MTGLISNIPLQKTLKYCLFNTTGATSYPVDEPSTLLDELHFLRPMKLKPYLLSLLLLSPFSYAQSPVVETPSADITLSEDETRPMSERGGEFTLFSSDGAVSLSDFRGKVVAIYFGYTKCPDVCPTNLSLLSSALKQMTEDELTQFQGVFISVDPGRDDPQSLAEYTQFFHPKIMGISGAPDIEGNKFCRFICRDSQTAYSNSAMIYGIAHTSEIYIMDRNGNMVGILPHASSPKEIMRQLRAAMALPE